MSAPVSYKPRLSRRASLICLLLMAGGLAAFLTGALGSTPWRVRAWQAFLYNWLFWSGMAQGGVVFACMLDTTDTHWGRPMKRLAEAFAAFLPLSLLLFVLFWPGMAYLYPWVKAPVPGLTLWLNPGLVFGRDLLLLTILYALCLGYVYYSVRPDLGSEAMPGHPGAGLRRWLQRNWRGAGAEIARSQEKRRVLAPAVLIGFCLINSLLAFDLVMALDPTWSSTLFGAYFFVVAIYGALALVAVAAAWARRSWGLAEVIGEAQFHDLGRLLFAFCLLTLEFFWSQLLVIWYGDLPEETRFLLVRGYGWPWWPFGWTVAFGMIVLPFVLLLRRSMKANPAKLFAVSLWIVLMVWLERLILVAPTVWPGPDFPFGPLELLIALGFAAAFVRLYTRLLDRVPLLPKTDPIFTGEKAPHHLLGEPEQWRA